MYGNPNRKRWRERTRIKQKIRDASLKSRLWQKVREARTGEEEARPGSHPRGCVVTIEKLSHDQNL